MNNETQNKLEARNPEVNITEPLRPPERETYREATVGEKKVEEYVNRILQGEDKTRVLEGLPPVFRNNIEDRLAQKSEDSEDGIPPQYRGFNSEVLEEIWTIPEYIDPEKNRKIKEQRSAAIAALKAREAKDLQKAEGKKNDTEQIKEIRKKLGIGQEAKTANEKEASPTQENAGLANTEERGKLNGWPASYELAKVAEKENVDLSKLSREEYAEYAVSKGLTIDDSQLRAAPWQRMCKSVQEIVDLNKKKRAKISKEADEGFGKFSNEMQKKANTDERKLQEGISVRQGTKDSNSWLFFKVNEGATFGSTETFKSYVSVKDLNTLTPEKFTNLMKELKEAGYNGDIKIFQDLAMQGINLNDQIVMHGASEEDAQLALRIAEKFFGEELDYKSMGKDEVIEGKNYSYSQILAKKIKDRISQQRI